MNQFFCHSSFVISARQITAGCVTNKVLMNTVNRIFCWSSNCMFLSVERRGKVNKKIALYCLSLFDKNNQKTCRFIAPSKLLMTHNTSLQQLRRLISLITLQLGSTPFCLKPGTGSIGLLLLVFHKKFTFALHFTTLHVKCD